MWNWSIQWCAAPTRRDRLSSHDFPGAQQVRLHFGLRVVVALRAPALDLSQTPLVLVLRHAAVLHEAPLIFREVGTDKVHEHRDAVVVPCRPCIEPEGLAFKRRNAPRMLARSIFNSFGHLYRIQANHIGLDTKDDNTTIIGNMPGRKVSTRNLKSSGVPRRRSTA